MTTTETPTAWHLTLLGECSLVRHVPHRGHDQVLPQAAQRHNLEARSALLLAYLALQGPTQRAQMAGLLWPESSESTARNNLRQRLKRMRDALGQDVLINDNPLRLNPTLSVDAVQLESFAFMGDHAKACALSGELLHGFDFSDTPELEEWVLATRERLQQARHQSLQQETARLEAAHDWPAALRLVERLLSDDPLAETHWQSLMRLHHLAGDRTSALRAFGQCRATLARELQLEPLPATLELARQIETQNVLPVANKPSIPISVLRPPRLLGREDIWQTMANAWQNQQTVVLVGPPGSGKSRLLQDFVTQSGCVAQHIEGRPGDNIAPYTTSARTLRQLLEAFPDVPLAPWVQRELSRLLPELNAGASPAAIAGEEDKLAFFAAQAQATHQALEAGLEALVLDDVQFFDTHSLEANFFVCSQHWGKPKGLKQIWAYRQGELNARTEDLLAQAVAQGVAVRLEMTALSQNNIAQLLADAAPKHHPGLAAQLHQHTGGNPMFVLETIKSLIETHNLENAASSVLPLPSKVEAVIQQRLGRLSPEALSLAQVAALAGGDHSLELASAVLERNVFELGKHMAELEAGQLMQAGRFAHDLIVNATAGALPHSVRVLIHERIATHLAQQSKDDHEHGRDPVQPARIAHHWLAAGQEARAVHPLAVAGDRQHDFGNTETAIRTLEQAIALNGTSEDRQKAQGMLIGLLIVVGELNRAEALCRTLEATVTDAEARCLLYDHWSYLHQARGSLQEAQDLARKAMLLAEDLAKTSGNDTAVHDSRYKLAVALFQSGEYTNALPLFESVLPAWRKHPNTASFINLLDAYAMCLQHLGRHDEAQLFNDEAFRRASAGGFDDQLINLTANSLYNSFVAGQPEEGIARAEETLRDLNARHSRTNTWGLRNNLAALYLRTGQTEHAILHNEFLSTTEGSMYQCGAWANLALLYHQQFRHEDAQHALQQALGEAENNDGPTTRFVVIRAAYTVGDATARDAVRPYLAALNRDALPAQYVAELEALLKQNP